MNNAMLLEQEAAKRILLTDGAYGTQIGALNLSDADYCGGLDCPMIQTGNYDILSLTRPDVLVALTTAYLRAGADIISTNTFGANRISQARYGTQHLAPFMNIAAASVARGLADRFRAKDGRPRFVAGAIGPAPAAPSGTKSTDLLGAYREQVDALLAGGVDFILVETLIDVSTVEAAIKAVEDAGRARGRRVPLMLSMTLATYESRPPCSLDVGAFWRTVRNARPLSVGLNCSFGADSLSPHLSALSQLADCLTMAYPNAGAPNCCGSSSQTPQELAAQVDAWAQEGLVNVLGGCCGSTPAHIAAMRTAIEGHRPRMRHGNAHQPEQGQSAIH